MKRSNAKLSVAIASAILSSISAPLAAANELEEKPIESIIVTGYKSSLDTANQVKRNSDKIVDAVVADEIGKLPDINVAESLARVSGVQLDRGLGEGSAVSIRGLRNNVTLANGREIFDAEGRGSNGPGTLDTSANSLLALIPAELISRLEVTKLGGADDIEGAIGGTINIVTRKPLDRAGPRGAATISMNRSDLSGENKPKASFYISNTFADDTFGLLFSYTTSKKFLRQDGFSTFGGYRRLTDGSTITDPDGNPLSVDPNGDGTNGIFHGDPRYWRLDSDKERTGASFIAQWQPNDTMELTYDFFYGDLEEDRDRRWLGGAGLAGDRTFTNAVFSPNEVLVSFDMAGRAIRTNAEYSVNESDIRSHDFNFGWDINDDIRMTAQATFNAAEQYIDREYYLLDDGIDYSLDLRPEFPTLAFDGSTLADPAALRLLLFQDDDNRRETDQNAFRVDFDHRLNDSIEFEYGARWSSIESNQNNLGARVVLGGGGSGLVDTAPDVFIPDLFRTDDFLSGEVPGLPREYLTISRSVGSSPCQPFQDFLGPLDNCDRVPERWNIEEDFLSFYGKVNFETTFLDMPLSGNFGVRRVDRDIKSVGTAVIDNNAGPEVTFDGGETKNLPSLTLKLDVNDDFVVRLGAAKVVGYANTEDLNTNIDIDRSGEADAGSPDLDPFEADQIDIIGEWYFSEGALLALAYFYKDIQSFLITTSQEETVPAYQHEDDAPGVLRTVANVERRTNGDGGKIEGWELLYQQNFTSLPGWLSGLGVTGSYSLIDSEAPDPLGGDAKFTQEGLSENNLNLTVFWEQGPVGLRLAYNYRDEYIDRIQLNEGVFSDSYEDLAFSARYDVTDSIRVSFDASNLLDETQRFYQSHKEATRSITEVGKSYNLGISATF